MSRTLSRRSLIGAGAILVAARSDAAVPQEINPPAARGDLLIRGARLFDGEAFRPPADLLVRAGRIDRIGHGLGGGAAGATPIDARGKTLLPGLIDTHFHLDGDLPLPRIMLRRGVTSVRDPGAWIEAYDAVRRDPAPLPRLFLCGPHLDGESPAYPNDARVVRDPAEARRAVAELAASGASAIKAYFRLSEELVRETVREAHRRGLPVTAHLEILDARDAIEAGVDGIEHVTSFGTALSPPREAEAYRQSVLANNSARGAGRYEIWSRVDLRHERCRRLIDLIVQRGIFVSATLAVFERRPGVTPNSRRDAEAFGRMLQFIGMAHAAGARITVGSHSSVPQAEHGWAYQRELELLMEAGLSAAEALKAGTATAAAFLRAHDRLGRLRRGAEADLVLMDGDPAVDAGALRRISGVWLAGASAGPAA